MHAYIHTQDVLKEILMALIPSAALKKKPSPDESLASATAAAGVKLGVSAGSLPAGNSGTIVLDRGDGTMIETTREAGAKLQEANALIVAGQVQAGMLKMKEAMALDPKIAQVDEESDKKCITMVQQMVMSGNGEFAEQILSKYWDKKTENVPDDTWGVMHLVECFIFMYKHLENWEDMLFWSEKALNIARKHKGEGTSEMATALSNFGLACGPLGRHKDAQESFEQALRIHESNSGPNSLQAGQTCHNLALLFRNTGQTELAESYYTRSRKVWVAEEQFPLLAVSYKDSAIMYRNLHNYAKAFEMLDEACEATKRIKNIPIEQVEAQLQLQAFRADLEERANA